MPPTKYHLLGAEQELYQKAYLLKKNIEKISGNKSGEWASKQKKDNTEKAITVGRRTREEIVKQNQMTALRFQTGGRQIVEQSAHYSERA